MEYDVALSEDGCEITLRATLPPPRGLPPLSELPLQLSFSPTFHQIEALLPQFVEELFCPHIGNQSQQTGESPASQPLHGVCGGLWPLWSWTSSLLAPAQEALRVLFRRPLA